MERLNRWFYSVLFDFPHNFHLLWRILLQKGTNWICVFIHNIFIASILLPFPYLKSNYRCSWYINLEVILLLVILTKDLYLFAECICINKNLNILFWKSFWKSWKLFHFLFNKVKKKKKTWKLFIIKIVNNYFQYFKPFLGFRKIELSKVSVYLFLCRKNHVTFNCQNDWLGLR